MKIHEFERAQVLAGFREDVFAFFSNAQNLEMLTPPWLRFQILTALPIDMQVGTRIDYALRLHGIRVRWTSEITAWEPPLRFIDEQVRGPYRLWVHEHRFESVAGGTRVIDHVRYAVPGGRLVNRMLVAPDLDRVFRYRSDYLEKMFGRAPEPGSR
jgi:ligand-binding SRPBCC domain-containing protein